MKLELCTAREKRLRPGASLVRIAYSKRITGSA
jgi:hypothetical protein